MLQALTKKIHLSRIEMVRVSNQNQCTESDENRFWQSITQMNWKSKTKDT